MSSYSPCQPVHYISNGMSVNSRKNIPRSLKCSSWLRSPSQTAQDFSLVIFLVDSHLSRLNSLPAILPCWHAVLALSPRATYMQSSKATVAMQRIALKIFKSNERILCIQYLIVFIYEKIKIENYSDIRTRNSV